MCGVFCGMFCVAHPLIQRFKYMRVQKCLTSLMSTRGVMNATPIFVYNDMKALVIRWVLNAQTLWAMAYITEEMESFSYCYYCYCY